MIHLDEIKLPAMLSADQPEWLNDLRNEAWKSYVETPLPENIDSLWKHTDPLLFLYDQESKHESVADEDKMGMPDTVQQDFSSGEVGGVIYNYAGKKVSACLAAEVENSGIIIGDLADFVNEHPKLAKKHLNSIVGKDFGKFEALNLATWQNGVVVYVPKNCVIKAPLYLMTQVPFSGSFSGRNIIITEDNAQLSLFHVIIGGSATPNNQTVNVVTESYAGENANLNHVMVQNLNLGARYYLTHRLKAERDAQALTVVASLGAEITKTDFGTVINGEGAHVDLYGFVGGHKRQKFDHFVCQDHKKPHSTSNNNFKVVVTDRSRSSFRGKIEIKSDAPFCEAYQENKNLILSSKARVESTPELEISQDEVRCSHGATMGPPDETQLFYLMSRGIPYEEATQLLIEGFMEASIQKMPEHLRNPLRNYIFGNLREH